MIRDPLPARQAFPHFLTIPTRWADNDIYGHVNNVRYYAYFDTVVNGYMIEAAGFDPQTAGVIGVVVETGCRYAKSVQYPDILHAGLRVRHLGTTSVRHEIGIFREGDDEAAAFGHFVHVFVTRDGNQPTAIPEPIRAALERLKV